MLTTLLIFTAISAALYVQTEAFSKAYNYRCRNIKYVNAGQGRVINPASCEFYASGGIRRATYLSSMNASNTGSIDPTENPYPDNSNIGVGVIDAVSVSLTDREVKNSTSAGKFLGGIKTKVIEFMQNKKTSLNEIANNPFIRTGVYSAFGYAVADAFAQVLRMNWSILRLARMLCYGLLIHGPGGFAFRRRLQQIGATSEPASVSTAKDVRKRVILEQGILTPLLSILLVTFVGVLRGDAPYQVYESCRAQLPYLLALNWAVWPIAHSVNFYYLAKRKQSHRSRFFNLIQFITNFVQSVIVN